MTRKRTKAAHQDAPILIARAVCIADLLRFLQLLGDFTGTGDEKLRQRAERAVSQCEDSDRIGTGRWVNRQQFERHVFAEA